MKDLICVLSVCMGVMHIFYSIRIIHIMLDPDFADFDKNGLVYVITTIMFFGSIILLNYL